MIDHERKPAFNVNVQTLRTLHIDFDQYTEGDPDFKQELVTLLIGNLKEFSRSLGDSLSSNNPEIFAASCHKTKIALCMLNDSEYDEIIETLRKKLLHDDRGEAFNHWVRRFNQLSVDIIASLNHELI